MYRRKGYLDKFWNSVHLEEEEEKEDLEIRECRNERQNYLKINLEKKNYDLTLEDQNDCFRE